jgi:hypothetical protein
MGSVLACATPGPAIKPSPARLLVIESHNLVLQGGRV